MASFNTMDANSMDFDFGGGMYDEDMDQDLFGAPDGDFQMGTNVFGQYYGNFHVGGQLGPQSEIINNRRDNVKEHFGQITPPASAKEPSAAPSSVAHPHSQQSKEDIAKLNRTQRARNAANKRHSKSRSSKSDGSQDNGNAGGEEENDAGKSTSMQREKNRVAAAKCRAKKKVNSEEMQETHREGSRANSFLHREVRELRDQKAFLRNTLLQHEPGVCQCHGIHQFNMAQAQQLVFGVGSVIAQPLSPSQDSVCSGHTPSSDASASRNYATPGLMGAPRRMSVPSRRQSVIDQSNHTFNQIASSDPTLAIPGTAPDGSQMPSQFTEFLHSSAQGRAGFS